MSVHLNELVDEFESLTDGTEAYLDRRTGEVHWYSELAGVGELPDDVDDEEKYISLPGWRELGLGKPLALGFAREVLPAHFDEVREIYSRKGAYRRFKGLLAQRKATDRWHEFKRRAAEKALRAWCEDNGIEVAD